MNLVKFTINGQEVQRPGGTSILEAARSAGIYIPTLCYHPDLPTAKGSKAAKVIFQGDRRVENAMPEESGGECGLCLVEIRGQTDLVGSCSTEIKEGMIVITESSLIRNRRQERLIPILARHPHACLTCAQQAGCSRTQCSSGVPENEWCCSLFGHCELQNVANYIGISDATPKWVPTDFPILRDDPLYERNYNLCIGCTRCIRVCRDLIGIEALGFVYDKNDRVRIGTLAPTLKESGCKFCTACVEVCPTGALKDKAVRPGKKKEDLVPCKEACPADIDVPGYLRCNPSPPEKWLAFDEEEIKQVPETEGVFQLLDEDHHVLAIKGTPNLRAALLKELGENEKTVWFEFEEDKMYSKRESELIQKYLQEHGKMPGGDSDLDELF